ncbi:protein kinase [Candidatus Micrarchaeota archaeon]|nr:protein kinase [Candidatus Micrarchaeota archaeon]
MQNKSSKPADKRETVKPGRSSPFQSISRTVARDTVSSSSRPVATMVTRVGRFAAKETLQEPPADSLTDREIQRGSGSTLTFGRLIGKGGMGRIYWGRMVDRSSGGEIMVDNQVAVKVISFEKNSRETGEERNDRIQSFFREVKLASRLKHDNIVRILAFGETEGKEPYFVMEFLRGESLEERIARKGRMAWDELRPLVLQTCDGLEAAHNYIDGETGLKLPIVHRDIKPANIFVTKDSRGRDMAKIVDFGLAKTVNPAGQESVQGNTVVGTPEYMSPEQIMNKAIDHRSDIYALGVLMYDLLSGEPPFPLGEGGVVRMWNRMLKEKPVPLREKGIDIPPELDGIISICLEKDPDKRFQSARELRKAIMESDGDVIDLDHLFPDESPPDTPLPSFVPELPERRASGDDLTRVYDSSKASGMARKGRMKKWIAAGSLLLATTIAGGTVGMVYHLSGESQGRVAEPRAPEKERKPADVAAEPVAASPAPVPIPADAAPDAAPEVVEHDITFRTNVSGASVIIEGEERCTTSRDGTCTISLTHGTEGVRVMLERSGFEDETVSVVPDEEQTRPVRMSRIQPREREPARRQTPRILSPD